MTDTGAMTTEAARAKAGTIEAFLEHANRLCKVDYAAFIDYCNQNSFDLPSAQAEDPFGSVYYQEVLQHYLLVAAVQQYQPALHEAARFADTKAPLNRQFPYLTRDPQTIGRYLMGVGYMVANIGVPPSSYVIEYGAGWGHVSLALGQSGYDVACVDIEPSFVNLINNRASAEQASVRATHGCFGLRPDPDRLADAVVFFEAFHHSLDHVALTRQIHDMMRPGGRLLLGGEPIYTWFSKPWGLRLDGHAVWAIRNFHWMELAFNEDYVIRLLLRHGFCVEKLNEPHLGPLGLLYIGTKIDGKIMPGVTLLPADEAASWNPSGEPDLKFTTSRSVISIADLVGWAEATVTLRNYLPLPLQVTLQFGNFLHVEIVPNDSTVSLSLPMRGNSGPLIILSDTHCPQELGTSPDLRRLGIALLSIAYR